MVAVGSLILVYFVEQQLEGWTFARDHWPLHMTLVPWFQVEDEEAAVRSLARVSGQGEPLRLGVGGQEKFGVNNDIPVNVVNNQEPVMALHKKLVEALGNADTAFGEQNFVGENYQAHITLHIVDGRHSNDGEELLVNDFHLVRLIDAGTCRVEKQFEMLK